MNSIFLSPPPKNEEKKKNRGFRWHGTLCLRFSFYLTLNYYSRQSDSIKGFVRSSVGPWIGPSVRLSLFSLMPCVGPCFFCSDVAEYLRTLQCSMFWAAVNKVVMPLVGSEGSVSEGPASEGEKKNSCKSVTWSVQRFPLPHYFYTCWI